MGRANVSGLEREDHWGNKEEIRKTLKEYQEDRRLEHIYRLNEREGDSKQMKNPGVYRGWLLM